VQNAIFSSKEKASRQNAPIAIASMWLVQMKQSSKNTRSSTASERVLREMLVLPAPTIHSKSQNT